AVYFSNLAAKPQGGHPRRGAIAPKFLAGKTVDLPAGRDARVTLAGWMTQPDNPFFARATVNRVWAELVGQGIVGPVDDTRPDNPPATPELLHALAADFVAHGYDLRGLVRTILSSRTYQLSSRTNATNRDDPNFSHAAVRRLSAEQMLDSIVLETGVG